MADLEGMNRKVPESQSGEQGFVEFTAWFYEENGAETVLHEKSVFHRVGGRWLYVAGEVITTPGDS